MSGPARDPKSKFKIANEPLSHEMALELVCGVDLWCNRHCRTSPVVLEGLWGQIWPKTDRKPRKTKISYSPYWPLLQPLPRPHVSRPHVPGLERQTRVPDLPSPTHLAPQIHHPRSPSGYFFLWTRLRGSRRGKHTHKSDDRGDKPASTQRRLLGT